MMTPPSSTFVRFSQARPMLSLALAFPLSYFTLLYVDSQLFFPMWSLIVVPALYTLGFLAVWNRWVKDYEWLFVGLFSLQLGFWSYLIWENGTTYGLTFTYWVYLLFTSNSLTKVKHLVVYYAVTYLLVSIVILLNPVQNPQLSPMFFVVQYTIIYFLLYLMSTQRIRVTSRQLSLQSKIESTDDEIEDLIDSLGAMIAYKDTQNRYLKINESLAAFMGKPRSFFEGVSLYDILPHSMAQTYHEEDLVIVRSGEAQRNVVEEMVTPLGEKRWIRSDKKPIFDKAGNVKGIVLFSVDITSQIEAEHRLQQNERLFREIIEESPYAILILDLGMKIIHANGHALKELRYSREMLTTLSIYDMLNDVDRHTLQTHIEHWEAQEEALSLALPLQGNLAEVLHRQLLLKAIKNDTGIPIYYTCVLSTPSPSSPPSPSSTTPSLLESAAQLHCKRVIASLYQSVRMTQTYVDLLHEKYSQTLPVSGREFVHHIQRQTQQANRLTDMYYNYLQLDPNAAKTVQPLSHIVTMAYEQFRPIIEARGTQVYISEMLPTLRVNKFQLTQLFTNLFYNALHEPLQVEQHILEVRCHRKGDYWQLAIADNNIDCPTDNFQELVARYQRPDNTEEEVVAAIGLATIQRIVEMHQGHIWLEHPSPAATRPGSIFYIAFPASGNAPQDLA